MLQSYETPAVASSVHSKAGLVSSLVAVGLVVSTGTGGGVAEQVPEPSVQLMTSAVIVPAVYPSLMGWPFSVAV
jgi:hypothetical protein